MTTTQIDKLFLELAQFTKATTPSENRLNLRIQELTRKCDDMRIFVSAMHSAAELKLKTENPTSMEFWEGIKETTRKLLP